MTETPKTPNAPRRKRIVRWSLGVIFLIFFVFVSSALWTLGRTIQMPDWVKTTVETRISTAVPNAEITFDNLTFEWQRDLHARILLERVVIQPEGDFAPVELSELETTLSYRRLLKGQVAPRDIKVSGFFLDAVRREEGTVAVGFGSSGQPRSQRSLTDVVAQIDDWLTLSQFERLTSVQVNAVTMRYEDQRSGRAWTADGGVFQLDRNGDDLTTTTNIALLSGRDYVSTLEFNYQSTVGSLAAQFGLVVEDVPSQDIATQAAPLSWLEIIDAPISGAIRVEIDETGEFQQSDATLEIGQGVLQPEGQVQAVPFTSAKTYFSFDPTENEMDFDELLLVTDWGQVQAEGAAYLSDFRRGLPTGLLGQFKINYLAGNPFGLFADTMDVTYAQTDFKLQFDPFELTLGELLLQDHDQSLLVNGKITAEGEDWNVRLNGSMEAIETARLLEWWPENAVAKTRKWVSENILGGSLHDLNFAVRSVPGSKPDVYFDFKYSDATVRFMKTLPPVEHGYGQAVMHNKRFVVEAAEGQVTPSQGGVLDVSGTTFVIPDVSIKPAPAVVGIAAEGTITSVLSLLDEPPFEFLSKANLPVDFADGLAQANIRLDFPIKQKLQPTEVEFSGSAALANVTTDHFVKDKTISAAALKVRVDNEALEVAGKGRVGSVPFDATFATPLGPQNETVAAINGEIELSERFIDEFEIGLSRDIFSGAGKGAFEILLPNNQPATFDVASDLNGVRLGIAALGWSKPAGTSADFKASGTFGTPVSVSSLSLSAPGLSTVGSVKLRDTGTLDIATFNDLKIGGWLNANVDMVGTGQGAPQVRVRGGSVDLRRRPDATRSSNAVASAGNVISAQLDRLVVSDGISLTNFTGDFSTGNGFSGRFAGSVNGGSQVSGTVAPSGNRSAVRIVSNDAGGVLRSAGVVERTSGGSMELTLNPVEQEGTFDGKLKINNIRVKNAPAMAELLNAISVIGLLDQLGGDGIAFSEVEADFKLTPSNVILSKGSAVGPSIGLSMDGIYRLNRGVFDMQGVISPVYFLNAIGRPISRQGEGLFGFNYSLTGSAENPSVSVNPLSLLTPGVFRDIFRRRPPSIEDPEQN